MPSPTYEQETVLSGSNATTPSMQPPLLKNSTTSVPKATYVPLNIKVDSKTPGGAAGKAYFVNSLNLQPGEVDAVRALKTPASTPVAAEAPPARTALENLIVRYEGAPIPSLLPSRRSSSTFRWPISSMTVKILRSSRVTTCPRDALEHRSEWAT